MALLPGLLQSIRRLNAVPAAVRRLLGHDRDAVAYGLGGVVAIANAGATGVIQAPNLPVWGGWAAAVPVPESPGRLTRPDPGPEASAPGACEPVAQEAPRGLQPGFGGTERVETKYCVPPDVADSVMRLAREFLEPDRNQPATGFQTVTSLYLDTRDLMFLRWTLDRQQDRFKLRLRTYGDEPSGVVWAEVKSKVQGIVRKRRVEVPTASIPGLLEDPWLFEGPAPDVDGRLEEFMWRLRRFGAEPKVLIRCERSALRGCYAGDETAVTIDRSLQYQPSCDLAGQPWAWQVFSMPRRVGPDGVVLELKHGSQAPVWMAELKTRLQPWRRSYSKYARAMTQLSLWECS